MAIVPPFPMCVLDKTLRGKVLATSNIGSTLSTERAGVTTATCPYKPVHVNNGRSQWLPEKTVGWWSIQ
jgi:hypothetical protein